MNTLLTAIEFAVNLPRASAGHRTRALRLQKAHIARGASHLLPAFLLLSLLFTVAPVFAAGDDSSGDSSNGSIHYVPPPHPAGHVRVNGIAGRGGNHPKLPNILFLTPDDHVGRTVQEQPTIFWYLSDSTDTKLKVTITKDGDEEPLLEVDVPGTKGIGHLSLAQKNVKLEPDVQYQVNIALIPDAKDRSEDLFTGGMIMRVKPSPALVARLVARADPLDRAKTYAREGIWYDALAVVSDQIDGKDAKASQAIAMHRDLMEQVSLSEVANYDLASEDK